MLNYRVQIHSETRKWHGNNIKSNAPYSLVLVTQLNRLASLAKRLSVRLRTKWLWVESRCCHLNFRYRTCFKQGVPWNSGNHRAQIHSETRTWHGNKIQPNVPYRWVLITQLSRLASLAQWLSVHLRTKWLWVQILLLSVNHID